MHLIQLLKITMDAAKKILQLTLKHTHTHTHTQILIIIITVTMKKVVITKYLSHLQKVFRVSLPLVNNVRDL